MSKSQRIIIIIIIFEIYLNFQALFQLLKLVSYQLLEDEKRRGAQTLILVLCFSLIVFEISNSSDKIRNTKSFFDLKF